MYDEFSWEFYFPYTEKNDKKYEHNMNHTCVLCAMNVKKLDEKKKFMEKLNIVDQQF